MRRSAVRSLTLIVGLLCALGSRVEIAQAQDTGAEEQPVAAPASGESLALEAAQVQERHCARAYGRDMTRALQSIAEVAGVWARVSEQYEKSGESYLLYWRGVLAQCMDQEEKGLIDFKAFVSRSGSSSLWAALVRDADRRIRQLERKTAGGGRRSKPVPGNPRIGAGLALGASLAAGSAVSAALAGVRWNEALLEAEIIYGGEVADLANSDPFKDGTTYSQQGIALGIAAVAMGTGSLVSFIVAASSARDARAAHAPPLVVPTPTGAVVTWEARW